MPADYGALTARERARLKAAQRRAGIAKQPKLKPARDSRTVSDVNRPKPVVRGENAREKARAAPIGKLRTSFEDLQFGRIRAAEFAKQVASMGMSADEKRDWQSYSGVRSTQVQREASEANKRAVLGAAKTVADVTGLTGAAWAIRHPIERITNPEMNERMEFPWGFKPKAPKGLAAKKAPRPAGADELIESLPEAKKLRLEQEALRTAERRKRIAAAAEARQGAGGGQAGQKAALSKLKGELPKLPFGKLKHYDEEARDTLIRHIENNKDIQGFDEIGAINALNGVLDGRLPTASQSVLLERAFGPEMTQKIAESATKWKQIKEVGLQVLNVPRAFKSTLDVSALLRQGLVLGARHPVIWKREVRPMLRAMKNPKVYEEQMEAITQLPSFRKMRESGLALTDLQGVANREEAFIRGNLAEQIPGGVGRVIRASSRSYTGFLNNFRAHTFEHYMQDLAAQGVKPTKQELKDIASWINTATGRGSIKSLERAMVPATALLFSPRLMASRMQLLYPGYYMNLSPYAQKQALRGMAQLAGAVVTTLGLAKLAGAEVGDDPRSADFGKIKVGDTRVDIMGGFQQYGVAITRIAKGESVSSVTGEMRELEGGFAKSSRMDILGSFVENKASPVAGYGADWLKNETFSGGEFNPAEETRLPLPADKQIPYKETGRLFLPLGVENAYEGFKESPEAGVASVVLGGLGLGTQTYGTDPVKVKEAKRRAALAKRGPVHVRDHEDRMTKLTAAAKAVGLPTSDPDVRTAVVSSRRIRDLDMRLRRAEKKKGTLLSYEERAKIVATMALRVFPQYQAEIKEELASKDWERVYRLLRHEIRAPYEDAVG